MAIRGLSSVNLLTKLRTVRVMQGMTPQSHPIKWVATGWLALLTSATVAQADLIHRYSFNEPATKTDGGMVTKDSVGKVDAKLKGDGASVADGKLVLKNDEG